MKLVAGDWFLVVIAVLQLCAVVSYSWRKEWLTAILYACYMVAQLALLGIALKARQVVSPAQTMHLELRVEALDAESFKHFVKRNGIT